MKKIILLSFAILLAGFTVMAQESNPVKETKSFLSFSAGTSFPLGDFGSNNKNNFQAGYAKAAMNLNVNYGYNIVTNFGIALNGFYTRYNIQKKLPTEVQISDIDIYEYIGLMIGPKLTETIGSKAFVDLKFLTGIASLNTPVIIVDNKTIGNGNTATSITPWSVGMDFRYNLKKNGVFIFNADYNHARPGYKINIAGQPTVQETRQLSTLNVNAGFGFRF